MTDIISPNHTKKLQTAKMKVPVIFHVSDDLMPNDATIREIENAASSPHVFHHISAMSDVHSKKGRKNPTGTVVASEKYLLPQINDTAPNCGMRFLKTNLTDTDLTPEKIEKLFTELVEAIPTKKYIGTQIPFQLVMDICRKGVAPVKKFFATRTKNEIENSFEQGNFFSAANENYPSERDILDSIPRLFLQIGCYRLGILGAAGNHFLDLMQITGIKDPLLAKKLGIYNGQYIFLLHTGSGLLGQYASYFYTPKKKEHFSQKIILQWGKMTFDSQKKKVYKVLEQKIDQYKDLPDFFAYYDNSMEGGMFLTAHNAAANQGFANRAILTHHLDQAIEKILGVNPELDLLYDMPHVFIHRESHFGKDLWIHRNGSVRANGPQRMANHPLFSQTGEPVFIPSSMSTPAYLGVGTDENDATFFSASHGTGRRRNPEENYAENKKELLEKMEKQGVRLF
ncbi:RtcB family protein, partial [Patescibacteria group bacterium]|nr:RtcB family protein [Patescibacteria group bacterium]